jgi:hypothetical protein
LGGRHDTMPYCLGYDSVLWIFGQWRLGGSLSG